MMGVDWGVTLRNAEMGVVVQPTAGNTILGSVPSRESHFWFVDHDVTLGGSADVRVCSCGDRCGVGRRSR